MITVTDRAIAQALLHQSQHPETRGQKLRVWISDKNCDGFMYGVAFDEPIEGDHLLTFGGLEVLIDQGTATYVNGNGTVLDYVDDERGRGFLVENPDARKYRGKFFRKQ